MGNPLAQLQTIVLPDQQALEKETGGHLAMARGFKVIDAESYELAAEELVAIKRKAKELEAKRTSITGPMNAALKAVNDLFRGPVAALEAAEGEIKGAMVAWSEEQDRKRREAERAAAQQAEAAQAAAAAVAKAAGASDEDAVLSAGMGALVAAPPVAQAPKVAGISKPRETVRAEVVDILELAKHVVANPSLANLLDVKQAPLNALAKALGPAANIPGVRIVVDKTLAVRA